MVQYKTHDLILHKTIYMTHRIKTLFHTKWFLQYLPQIQIKEEKRH